MMGWKFVTRGVCQIAVIYDLALVPSASVTSSLNLVYYFPMSILMLRLHWHIFIAHFLLRKEFASVNGHFLTHFPRRDVCAVKLTLLSSSSYFPYDTLSFICKDFFYLTYITIVKPNEIYMYSALNK